MTGGGVGSASIVLVFVVLGLTIFALISLIPALTEQTLIYREITMVQSYYSADALAEEILAEILRAPQIPSTVNNINITSNWSWDLLALVVSFATPISDTKVLYVSVAIEDNHYQILSWQMEDSRLWEEDNTVNVWTGDTEELTEEEH